MAISDKEAILIPFSSGTSDRNSINETENPPDNTVSWKNGFTPNYSRPINSGGKLVQRKDFNALFYKLSKAIRYFQVGGVATLGNLFGSTATKGSIYWHKVDGRWLIIEAKTDNASTSNFNQSEWNCYTFLDYVNGKPSIKELTVTDQLTVGTTVKIGKNSTSGCPTPTEDSSFVPRSYVTSLIQAVSALPTNPSANTIYLLRTN